jgi:hypothetical protein
MGVQNLKKFKDVDEYKYENKARKKQQQLRKKNARKNKQLKQG